MCHAVQITVNLNCSSPSSACFLLEKIFSSNKRGVYLEALLNGALTSCPSSRVRRGASSSSRDTGIGGTFRRDADPRASAGFVGMGDVSVSPLLPAKQRGHCRSTHESTSQSRSFQESSHPAVCTSFTTFQLTQNQCCHFTRPLMKDCRPL